MFLWVCLCSFTRLRLLRHAAASVPQAAAGWGLGKGARRSVVSVGVFALADEAAPRRCYARAAGTLPLRCTTPLLPLQPLQPLPYDSAWGLNIASLCPCVSLCVCVCGGGLRRAGGGGGLLAAGPARM